MRLIYVDDSGADATRLAVFAWVELDVRHWAPALRSWLDYRHELHEHPGINVDYELHATKFVNGRGRPTGTAWDDRKGNRGPVMTRTLDVITLLPGLSVGAVYARSAPDQAFRDTKVRTYVELVRWLDTRLTSEGEIGMIMMDGDGTDPMYRAAHRELKLEHRSLIEDPCFHASHHSQWVQMADLVAYTAYMHLATLPAKGHTWGWYADHLAAAAVTGAEPLNVGYPEPSEKKRTRKKS